MKKVYNYRRWICNVLLLMVLVSAVACSSSPAEPVKIPVHTITPVGQFSGLHVSGNILVNEQGQQVVLHGVNRSGAEYSCVQSDTFMDGPADESSVKAMADWKINVVRVPFNEHCWLGLPGTNPGGAGYQQQIQDYVALLEKYKLYVILDMQFSGSKSDTSNAPMANRSYSASMWRSVATAFKGDTKVIFDLVNEPDGISWECWKDGTGCSYTGMQQLINAIRSTGAQNIIMAGGVASANDLSGWLANRPMDRTGNLVASWHFYGNNACNSTRCYDSTLSPVAATVPLIAGEVGESWDGSACGVTKSDEAMDWLDRYQLSYLAWTWDTWDTNCGDLSLITDYDGTPHYPNGTNFKVRLAKLASQYAIE